MQYLNSILHSRASRQFMAGKLEDICNGVQNKLDNCCFSYKIPIAIRVENYLNISVVLKTNGISVVFHTKHP